MRRVSLGRLKTLLAYDPETGALTWLIDHSAHARRGQRAGHINKKGYRIVGIDRRYYRSSHLAWKIATGSWPARRLDHRNRQKADDRFENLRQATQAQNVCNVAKQARATTSKFKGVRWNTTRSGSHWMARISVNNVRLYLGIFDIEEEAARAYDDAARVHHGEFAWLNFP